MRNLKEVILVQLITGNHFKLCGGSKMALRTNSMKNINTQEYWDKHIAKPDFGLRQKKYLELAGNGQTIVELGCGMSPFLDKACNFFDEVWGVDFSQKTLEEASKEFPDVTYLMSPCDNTPIADESFDVSVAGELMDHLDEPKKLAHEMARITKRRIILSVAKMEKPHKEHVWEFEEEDLNKLFKKYGKVNVEEIHSKRFPGRSYLFMTCDL